MAEPNYAPEDDDADPSLIVEAKAVPFTHVALRSVTLEDDHIPSDGLDNMSAEPRFARALFAMPIEERRSRTRPLVTAGNSLGTFRNTYYDFPNETSYSGELVPLKSGKCEDIKSVPRGFYEAVCVQGSGLLSTGSTVSFARRDCDCALSCPRTGQRICFDALDRRQFPWGRGASGVAITPLLTVAVDSNVVPLGAALYIPEYDGLPTDASHTSFHDGCFIAQDRGLKVKGSHVDVFTGDESITKLWNALVPSNEGVTVVVDHPRCHRAD